VNQRRASRHRVPTGAVWRAPLTAVPTGSQVFAMAAPMVAPIPEVWVSAVPAATVEPTEERMAEPMAEQMEALTAEPMAEQMEALTAEPTEARTVGRVDALAEPIRLTSQG
jgi:hypothetical protein